MNTGFTELVGCPVPIQQAGIGAIAGPELAAAVSEAGGLGMLGMARSGGGSVHGVRRHLDRIRELTDRPFGMNFIVTPEALADFEPGCFELAANSARVIEFFYGWPDPKLVELIHRGGALVSWQVGSREEAMAAGDAGCDLVIAQGIAAGGHVRGTIGLQALLDDVLASINVPVLAAGGIGTGRAMAAALAAGASGVRIGTRFVAAAEADPPGVCRAADRLPLRGHRVHRGVFDELAECTASRAAVMHCGSRSAGDRNCRRNSRFVRSDQQRTTI